MKHLNMKNFFAMALLVVAAVGCKDQDFEDGKIQSVDNHGKDQNMIGTAVTATGSDEFLANAIDSSPDGQDITLIPVVLSSANVATEDIHVQMVPALDSLDSYNAKNDTEYIMPGDDGTPAFTLVDNGLVTIPKGSSVGYLKIHTVPNDYFGDAQYAFAYKIQSVQEGKYSISGNHNFGIVAIIPKNKYDGKYTLNITTKGWSAYGISNDQAGDYGTVALGTTGLKSNIFVNTVGGGNLQAAFTAGNATKTAFGATAPVYTFDDSDNVINVDNAAPDDGRGRDFVIDTSEAGWNFYDPATKTLKLHYTMKQNGRPDQDIKQIMVYAGPR